LLSPDSIGLVLKQKNRKHEAAMACAAEVIRAGSGKNLPERLLRRKKRRILLAQVESPTV
jgi:hypothetical protein